jgi:aspartyl/asparaginyl-tRNA synthetase
VHRVRELGKISFLLLRDRSGLAQCVVDGKAEVTPEDAAGKHRAVRLEAGRPRRTGDLPSVWSG